MDTFEGFVFRDLSGAVIVHDRYQNYDKLSGVIHQLCTAHLLRDIEDAARSYPGAIWPGQSADALRALIHAASTARKQGLDTVPATAAHLTCGCSATASWRACPRYAACPARTRSNRRPGCCWNACTTVSMTSCGSLSDLRIPPTSNGAERDLRPAKTQQKYPGGSAPKPPPATGTPSAAGHLADIRGVAAARPGGSGRGQ
jgi:transposase